MSTTTTSRRHWQWLDLEKVKSNLRLGGELPILFQSVVDEVKRKVKLAKDQKKDADLDDHDKYTACLAYVYNALGRRPFRWVAPHEETEVFCISIFYT